MALAAHFERLPQPAGKQRAPRRAIRLDARGILPTGSEAEVTILNISATGMLIECREALGEGEMLAVDLPHAETTQAEVVWTSGHLHGCQFGEPVSNAVLSAVELQGATGRLADASRRQEQTAEPFGERLQRLRKARGLSLGQVAAELGVSKPTVWAWEQGRARPVESRIDGLAGLLHVSSGELLSGRDESELNEVLGRCRRQIAAIFGTGPDRVRIMVEL